MVSKVGRNLLVYPPALLLLGGLATIAWRQGLWGTLACTIAASALLLTGIASAANVVRNPASRIEPPPSGADENALLRAMLDQAPTALLAVESGGRVRALNRVARRMFGTNDMVPSPPRALLEPLGTRCTHSGRSWRIDRAELTGSSSSLTLLALVDVDAEEHAAEARATRELLRTLGHEVMNTLAPIASLAESALAVLPDPIRRDRLLPGILGTLSHRAENLHRFTEAYRLMARLPQPVLSLVRLEDLLDELAYLFEAQWRGRVSLRTGGTANASAALDRGQIIQALWALLQNGAEAALAHGVSPSVQLTVVAARDQIRFQVSDNGAGIDRDRVVAIFDPFVTTKTGGNGIGLTAARQIAQSHGGNVVHRANCQFTTFEFAIPA